ncbi:MAG: hypothetical protein JJ971_03980 [Balneolaceae bacterium]|nr:hypothetical protein [Balneolaceae bacterium]MBO6545532.1 hypothetical protein [Balneolaceae bacterium]MBO6646928.1 hypothetical protein [Balneolaceae bacterium]
MQLSFSHAFDPLSCLRSYIPPNIGLAYFSRTFIYEAVSKTGLKIIGAYSEPMIEAIV